MVKNFWLFTFLIWAAFYTKASASAIDDIHTYLKLFALDYKPTLADFRKAYPGDTDEDILRVITVCDKRGWAEPVPNIDVDNECSKYLKKIEKNPSQTPSLYLEWLRTKIPLSPKVTVLKVKTIRKKDNLEGEYPPYQLIQAQFNQVHVVLWRGIDEEDRSVEGEIKITEIEGIQVDKMFKDYLKTLKSQSESP